MPPASQTAHRILKDTALPYISNSSVTSVDPPQYVVGSKNILTSLRQMSERFPGFASQAVPSPVGGWINLQRQFVWERWIGSTNGGAFLWMGCDIRNGKSTVWKFQFGADSVPILIFTSNSTEPFDFVDSNNTCYFGNGTDMRTYDSVTVRTWGITAPASGPTLTLIAGSLNVYTSYCYVTTYYDSSTDHESSPSPISACSGVFSAKSVQLGLTASTNPRVTNIRVYRTPDGGAQDPTQMQEITGSPFPNTTGNVTDTTLDTNLSIRVAPAFFRNDPPPPMMGVVHYEAAGRIYGFKDNAVHYSGFEEIANGVPEECFPSGLDGNSYPYSKQVTALAPLIDGVVVFTPSRISKIEGESLDTFRRYTLLEKRGTRSRTSVVAVGGSVAWLDTSNTLWVSDLGEIGLPVRPDLATINPQTCFLAVHISGIYHWLLVLDGSTGTLLVCDLDKQRWMPPRELGVECSALWSGETSEGVIDLLMARNRTKSLKLTPNSYNDDGQPYVATSITSLVPMTPDGNTSFTGTHDWTEVKTDTHPPTQISTLTDDDPTQAAAGDWKDVTVDAIPSPLLANTGKNLQTWRYPKSPTASQMMALRFDWAAVDSNFRLYMIDHAFSKAGG